MLPIKSKIIFLSESFFLLCITPSKPISQRVRASIDPLTILEPHTLIGDRRDKCCLKNVDLRILRLIKCERVGREVYTIPHPTDVFTITELHNPSIDGSNLRKIWSIDGFRDSYIVKGSDDTTAVTDISIYCNVILKDYFN